MTKSNEQSVMLYLGRLECCFADHRNAHVKMRGDSMPNHSDEPRHRHHYHVAHPRWGTLGRCMFSQQPNADRGRMFDSARLAATSQNAADLARDQRALEAQLRDIRHDQRDIDRDEQRFERWR
jgi:hypothetical protein